MAKKKVKKKRANKTGRKVKPSQPSSILKVGDCVKLLSRLGPGCANLAFADPPYNIDWPGYDKYSDRQTPDYYINWCGEWIQGIHNRLTEDGSFWLAIGDEFVSELDVLAKKIGFYKRTHVIWYYTFGVACPKGFARTHTHLLHYTKHKTKFTFNGDDKKLRVPSARQLVYKDARANPKGKLPDNTWVLSPLDLPKAFTQQEDTWLESRICGTFKEREHRGTYKETKTVPQMPMPILDRIITASSNKGDLVIDPFLGTGTTGVSAAMLGRDFWGCDISKNYVARCKQRIKKVLP